jgi:hypothetical protein
MDAQAKEIKNKVMCEINSLTSLTTSQVGLLIFSITDNGSVKCHSNM